MIDLTVPGTQQETTIVMKPERKLTAAKVDIIKKQNYSHFKTVGK